MYSQVMAIVWSLVTGHRVVPRIGSHTNLAGVPDEDMVRKPVPCAWSPYCSLGILMRAFRQFSQSRAR